MAKPLASCGVYSAVNAVRALRPEFDHDDALWLFDALMQALPKVTGDPATAAASGLGGRQLALLIGKASRYIADEHDVRLAVARMPPRLPRGGDLDALWAWLARTAT